MPLKYERKFRAFPDGSTLSYARGVKDDWCVYLTDSSNVPDPVKDVAYFTHLFNLAQDYGAEKVYSDFVSIYDKTTSIPLTGVADYIETQIIPTYKPQDQLPTYITFCTIYMAMVAEYYYVSPSGRPSRINKRVKRLGVYQVLFGILTPTLAAQYSRGKNFQVLDDECKKYGF